MPDDQKQTELSPEEVKRKALYDEYTGKSYWTFREGMDLVILDIH